MSVTLDDIKCVDRPRPADVARQVLPVLASHATEVDVTARFPQASLDALRTSGLLGLLVPQAYGGFGGDLSDLVEVAQILASECLSTAMIWGMHCQQVDALVRFGGPRLHEELLPRIADGHVYVASVTTELGKGGHLLSAVAPLYGEGGRLVVERDAPIVTGGAHADGFLITMRASQDAPAQKVSLVYLDRAQATLELRDGWDTLGMRGTESLGMHISGEIADYQVVGEPGKFRTVAIESLIPTGHLAWSACWLGAARAALGSVVEIIRSPNRPASLDPKSDLVAERLARVRIDLELVGAYLGRVCDEVLTHRAAQTPLSAPATQIHLNSLKVASSELTFRAVDRLIQITGLSLGYRKGSPLSLERHFRDLRSASLNYANDRLLTAIGSLLLLDRDVHLA